MPHIILEYSSNLPYRTGLEKYFSRIHQVLESVGGIKQENCKSRARVAEDFYVGNGDAANAFVHVNVSFVQGRDHEVKQEIGKQVLSILKELFHDVLSNDLQITVQIEDILMDYYSKYPAGTLGYQN